MLLRHTECDMFKVIQLMYNISCDAYMHLLHAADSNSLRGFDSGTVTYLFLFN